MQRGITYSAKEHSDFIGIDHSVEDLALFNVFRLVRKLRKPFHKDRLVDIGCGDGIACRSAINLGFEKVLGIDASPEMIDIAKGLNLVYGDRISYQVGFIEDLKGKRDFDFVVSTWLLNYAKSFEELSDYCLSISNFLKPGGVFVAFNNNPFDTVGGDFRKYNFTKTLTGTNEGDSIIYDYRPKINPEIINFYLSPEMHEQALYESGFMDIEWHPLQLRPGANKEFYKEYFDRDNLPAICLTGEKIRL